MKFARYLDENVVPEWKRVYIQYRGLKKLIKRVAEHRQARLECENELGVHAALSDTTAVDIASSEPHFRSTAVSASQYENSPNTALSSSSGFRQRRDYGGTQPHYRSENIPPISLEGTGLALLNQPELSTDAPHAQSFPTRDAESRAEHNTRPEQDIADASSPQSPTEDISRQDVPRSGTNVRYEDAPKRIDRTSLPAKQPPNRQKRSDASVHGRRILINRSNSSGRLSFRSMQKDAFPTRLDELIRTCFDAEEAKIFSACDNELDRIVAFYEARELEAAHKYGQLTRQLKELADHRREYRAKHSVRDSDKTLLNNTRSRLSQLLPSSAPLPKKSSASLGDAYQAKPVSGTPEMDENVRQNHDLLADDAQPPHNVDESEDVGDRRRAAALAQMQDSLKGWDEETDKAIRAANKAAAMSHDPEAYAAARKKLKAAVLEYYKFLETLNNYKILNRTGFAKVMKKLSKTVDVPCADAYYEARMAPSILVTSDRIERLLKATEDIYAAYFEHGNRKSALNRLRVREEHTSHHFSVFRSGLFLGVAICAAVAGLVEAMRPTTQARIPQWPALLRVYGAEFIPTLFALLFGLNLAWWHSVRINTVFIFEWDVRHTMDRRQFFELPAIFMLLLSVFLWISFTDPFPSAIAPTSWPTVWLVIVTLAMLNPFPVLVRESRFWFARSLLRVFSAGCKRVEFRDFFLGDELNSIAWSISNFWYMGCEWRHDWAYPDQCAPNSTYWTAVLLSVPALLRLGQCVRRWMDSDYRTHLHLVNAGKYTSAVLNNFFYIHYRKGGSSGAGATALWIVFAAIYSLWHILWDLIMDWSLLRPRARYFLLRDELAYPVPIYYVFIAADIIGRCVWIIYLIPGSASVTLRSFLAALIEMIRRVCWNNLRVENEQIGNTDSFKVIRDLPLPYHQGLKEDDADEGLDGDHIPRDGLFANVRMSKLRHRKSDWPVVHDEYPGMSTDAVAQVSGVKRPSSSYFRHTGAEEHRAAKNIGRNEDKGRHGSLLIERLRNTLVPDAHSSQYGRRLDERAVTKGQSGRDYTPRAHELDGSGDSDLDDSAANTTADESAVPYSSGPENHNEGAGRGREA